MKNAIDNSIFKKQPKFLGIFVVTSLVGILLVSLAVYHASREMEVIYEVDNMHRILHAMLGKEKIKQVLSHGANPAQVRLLSGEHPTYRFYVLADEQTQPLSTSGVDDRPRLDAIDLEATRINPRGGSFKADGQLYTWTQFRDDDSHKRLLLVHTFKSAGPGILAYVYKKRMIIPVFFYVWLMIWVALIFNHLLKELKHQQRRMEYMALHDPLTNLPNRCLMQDRLSKLIQSCHRDNTKFAFALIDFDGFKKINDRYGHAYGDEFLRQAARRLEDVLRESDTAARHGGDEFTLLLPDIDEHAWQAVFTRILATLIGPYTLFDTTVSVNASIGVAIYPLHGQDSDTLLRNADQAMYVTKAKGGGIQQYHPGQPMLRQNG